MDILTANQITCHIKREGVNTIWPLFTNSYPWFTANLLVIYKIYVHLMFTVNYCFCQAMIKNDILIMIDFEIIQILMQHHVIACIFIKNHLIQDMCPIHGELTRDFRNNVLKNLVLRTFWKVFFRRSKIAN